MPQSDENTPQKVLKSLSEIFNNTLATLVLYNTSLESSVTFQSLSRALEMAQLKMNILVYDNSATAQLPPYLPMWTIHYIHNPANPGVSKAYNLGFELAKQKEMKWLWLLDQDTDYPVSTFEMYSQAIQQWPQYKLFVPQLYDSIGLASPLQFRYGGGKRINITPGIHSIQNYLFHNCGLLISLKCFERAGGFDERFALDFSDLSFVHRLRKITHTFVLTVVSGSHTLATTSTVSAQERAIRFKSYASACRTFKKEYSSHDFFISIRLFLRSLKLSWKHKTFEFIIIYLKS